jgi:hypothetical protein
MAVGYAGRGLPGRFTPGRRLYRQEREGKSIKLESILAFGFLRHAADMRRFLGAFRRYATSCLLLPLLVLLGSGCSTINVAYTAGPTVLAFMADGYLDLDSDQSALLKERILAVREWNRTTQMTDYARFLGEVRGKAVGNVTPDDVARAVAEARKRWSVMAEHVAGEIADMAPQLTPANIAALKKKIAKRNAEYVKETLEAPPHKTRERRFERIKEEAERWYGSLDDAQLERIRGWVAALPVNYPLALEDRKRRQGEFVAIMEAAVSRKADRAETRQRLQRLLTAWETGRSPAYQAFAAQVTAENLKLAANVVNMATPAQREILNRRAQRWVDDMNALATRPAP